MEIIQYFYIIIFCLSCTWLFLFSLQKNLKKYKEIR